MKSAPAKRMVGNVANESNAWRDNACGHGSMSTMSADSSICRPQTLPGALAWARLPCRLAGSPRLRSMSMPRDSADQATQWSQLEKLHSDDAADSWRWFIRRYQAYVAAVLRRLIWRPEDVEAATTEFWGYLFSSRALERADRSGRFRSFLSGVLRNYAGAWLRGNAPRPTLGEQDAKVALPAGLAESEELSLWAQQILHLGLERLGREYPAEEKALRLFYGLSESPGGESRVPMRATAIAVELGCQANAMYQTLFRARSRLRDCIAVEVAATIGAPSDLQHELSLLTAAVGRAAPGIVDGEADEGGV